MAFPRTKKGKSARGASKLKTLTKAGGGKIGGGKVKTLFGARVVGSTR